MQPQPEEFERVLRSTHLFNRLGSVAMQEVVDCFETIFLREGETLYQQGTPADSFYIIITGSVDVRLRQPNREERWLATLTVGDYFGQDELFSGGPREASVVAASDTTLLRLDTAEFDNLLRRFPLVRDNLKIAERSHRLSRNMRLRWLSPGEVIYLATRRHPFFLLLKLLLPAGLALGGLLGFLTLTLNGYADLWILDGLLTLLLVVGLGWAVWAFLDWRNDYYLVTNQRVVALRKVALLYDSRQEAPLNTILSVSQHSDQIGRLIGYGDVNIRTFTGNLLFAGLTFPRAVAALVEEQWYRTRQSSRREENELMNQAIRRRLGWDNPDRLPLEPESPTGPALPQPLEAPAEGSAAARPPLPPEPGLLESLFGHFYDVRFQVGDVITYRKHWFVLLRETWQQMALILLVMTLLILRLAGAISLFTVEVAVLIFGLLLIGFGLWYLYDYWDWRNDIFQLTNEQVLDIEKKPLGREEKKAAPLENILSTRYERLGLIGHIFNYGTVYITVGGTTLTFDHVHNPSGVQQDIFLRINERKQRKRQTELAEQRERTADWFASYYDLVNQGGVEPPPLPEPPPETYPPDQPERPEWPDWHSGLRS